MNKLLFMALGIGIILPATVTAAQAQQNATTVNPKARSKAVWYNSPREIQIIDERPVVRDFREAPQTPAPIQLPPGPGSHPGAYGGGGGAMGDDGSATLPGGGLPMGGGNGGEPGYRTPDQINPNAVPLDKVGFNRNPSNIPAAGMGPKGPLPGGFTTGIYGKVAAPKYPNGLPASPLLGKHTAPSTAPAAKATPVYSYNPGNSYGNGVGTSSGNGGASTAVTGKLMNRLLNKVQ
jgi:hypothetical protein